MWKVSSKLLAFFIFGIIIGFTIDIALAETPNLGSIAVYVVEPISGIPIFPDTFPIPGKNSNKVTISACRGEFEPASFVLRAVSKSIKGLTLSLSDLVGPMGRIPANALDLKLVKVWYQADTAWKYFKKYSNTPVLVPELLLNDDTLVKVDYIKRRNYVKLNDGTYKSISDYEKSAIGQKSLSLSEFSVRDAEILQPFDIPFGQNKQLWLTVAVPKEISPGLYTGSIRTDAEGIELGKLTLEVFIHNFDLETSPMEYSIYYRGILDKSKGSISSEEKNEQQMLSELINMKNHGVTNPTMYQPFDDKELLKRALELRKTAGIDADSLYYLGIRTENLDDPQAETAYSDNVKTLASLCEPFGIKNVYVYGIDEAPKEIILKQRRVWQAVQNAGGKIFAAAYTPGHFEIIGGIVDLFIDGTVPQRKIAAKFHSVGHRIFSYNQPQAGVENPLIYRKNYGIRLWQNDFDGAMVYAYQAGFGSIWNDFDDPTFRDHNFTYPTINGMLDTIAWEGFREAVDDVRYIKTLEKAIQTAEKSTALENKNAVNQAKEFIEWLKKYDSDDLTNIRREVVAFINKLQQQL